MRKLFFLLIASIFFILLGRSAFAISDEECDKGSTDSACIDYFTRKLNELGSQKRTLASQIGQFDSQIKITQLKIADAQSTIAQLEKEINVLGFRIGYITDSVDKLQVLLKKRIVATYEKSYISNFELLISSTDFSDLMQRVQYLKVVQENDKKLLANLQDSKSKFANQKDEREVKQAQIEENKKKLEVLGASLNSQKAEKQALLIATRNDEKRFQQLLSEAQAEQAVVFGGGTDVFMRDVNQGDSIGSIASWNASKGCSSGAHLHFETHKGNSVNDPNNYLQPKSIQYNGYDPENSPYGSVNPHGDLPWPINDPIYINQGFGVQRNSFIYGPAGHTGIDMQSGPGDAGGDTVKAVKNGKLYGGSYQCGGSYPGSLYYAKVVHDDGLTTWYLHMIPN